VHRVAYQEGYLELRRSGSTISGLESWMIVPSSYRAIYTFWWKSLSLIARLATIRGFETNRMISCLIRERRMLNGEVTYLRSTSLPSQPNTHQCPFLKLFVISIYRGLIT
jgi:hypothetical protein